MEPQRLDFFSFAEEKHSLQTLSRGFHGFIAWFSHRHHFDGTVHIHGGLIKEGKDIANRKRLVQEQKKKTEKGRDARRKQSGRYR
ncbi:hypothetical protein R3I94_018660 [Phoxinus phoxinus]